ncbi:MAG: phosphatidate cytidylyltransferase [Ktedonobacteraceae bacterium]|nr:phosphatidate cytidylyltransferase [Ktedonobacteraceae bacterium]
MQDASEQKRESGMPDLEKGKKQSQSVGQRWLTAGIAIPIVLVFAWFGGWFAFVAILLIVVLNALELRAMLFHAGYRPLTSVSFGLSVLLLISAMVAQYRLLIIEVGVGSALLISFLWLLFRKRLDGAMVDWALTLAISIYLGWPMSCMLLLRGYGSGAFHLGSNQWLTLPSGVWWLLVVLLGVWGFDAAAFFSGRYFGRHRLAPMISPAKTWEGVAGGMVLSIIACLVLTVVPLHVPWYLAVLLGVLIGGAATLGDLAESLLKRQTHVKDSGQIMPGHGGMLDRTDSILFAAIVVYIFAQLLQVIG